MLAVKSKLSLFVCFHLIAFSVFAQSDPTTLTGGDILTNPGGIVRIVVQKVGVTTMPDVAALTGNERVITRSFFDGFGRPLESIIQGHSPAGKDVISFNVYDAFGRQTKTYLPYASSTYGNGTYRDRSDAITEQAAFYNGTTMIATDSKPYAQSQIEESPMQRVVKQGSVGDGYQVDQDHITSSIYRFNVANEVRKWDVTGTSGSTSFYTAGELFATEVTNEKVDANNRDIKSMVFTDKLGRVVMKRQKADETGYTYVDTYYVYDLFGNLIYVVTPKAVRRLAALGGTWDVTSVPEAIYSYVYDDKNRLVEKKAPGSGAIYMVYDPLDRLVLVQDKNMRPASGDKKWHYRKYDSQGRIVIEGIYIDNTHTTRSDMQTYVNGQTCYGSSSTTYYEVRSNGLLGYTDQCFPTGVTQASLNLVYYYDDYDFDGDGSADQAYTATASPSIGEETAVSDVLSMPTGMKKKVLGTTSDWLPTYTFYDKWFRVVQTKTNNLVNSTVADVSTVAVDFAGRVLSSRQYKTGGTGNFEITVNNSFTYDNSSRLQTIKQKIGSTEVTVAKYVYNELGQVVDKKLHSDNDGTNWLQSVDFRYNIRGQLLSINNSSLDNDGTINNDVSGEYGDIFGMEFIYDQQDAGITNVKQYSGMLSAIKWRSKTPYSSTPNYMSYLFTYDKLYRLTASESKQKTNGGSSWNTNVDVNKEAITYDESGNIKTVQRGATGSLIDDLTYNYDTNGDNNQLRWVSDAATTDGYKHGTASSAIYTYDDNGNLVADTKKGITLTYNELNKVTSITKSGTGRIDYQYDGSGVRISKKIYNSSNVLQSAEIYIDGYVVDKDYALSYFAMAEGRVRKSGTTYTYEYFLRDHQGNVRSSFEADGTNPHNAKISQTDDYWAFGMRITGYTPTIENKKLYNGGNDWQDDLSVGEYSSTFYREYDPVLGRFNSVDPMAEATAELSIYHYAGNNPVNFNDPMGDLTEAPKDNSTFNYSEFLTHAGSLNATLDQVYDFYEEINKYLNEFHAMLRELAGGPSIPSDFINLDLKSGGRQYYAGGVLNFFKSIFHSLHKPKPWMVFESLDGAAYGFAYYLTRAGYQLGEKEYSSLLYSFTGKDKKTYYSFTFPKTAKGGTHSPGQMELIAMKLLPKGAKLEGHIHSHQQDGSNEGKYFSFDSILEDRDQSMMKAMPDLPYYLLNSVGNIIIDRMQDPNSLTDQVTTRTIARGFYPPGSEPYITKSFLGGYPVSRNYYDIYRP